MMGKAGIVTGGASGIGHAVVARLLREGAHVHAIDSNVGLLDRLAAEFTGMPLTLSAGDVADEAFSARLVRDLVRDRGRIDFLVNAAGIVEDSTPLHDLDVDNFDRVLAVNLRGAFLYYRAVCGGMIETGTRGAIVNIASTGALRPVRNAGPYVASKLGLIGLTKTAAMDVAGHGIRVNAICPGVTDTPLFRANIADGGPATALAGIIPLQRLAAAADIAAGVYWLLSDEASYVTGTVLPIDGGLTLV